MRNFISVFFLVLINFYQVLADMCMNITDSNLCYDLYSEIGYLPSNELGVQSRRIYNLIPVIRSKCHKDILTLICVSIIPPCKYKSYPVCSSFCSDVISSCSNIINEFSQVEKSRIFHCPPSPVRCIDRLLRVQPMQLATSSSTDSSSLTLSCPAWMQHAGQILDLKTATLVNCSPRCHSLAESPSLTAPVHSVYLIVILILSVISIVLAVATFIHCCRQRLPPPESSVIHICFCHILTLISLISGSSASSQCSLFLPQGVFSSSFCLSQFLLLYTPLIAILSSTLSSILCWFLSSFLAWTNLAISHLTPLLSFLQFAPPLVLTLAALRHDSIELQLLGNVCFLPLYRSPNSLIFLFLLPLLLVLLVSWPLFFCGLHGILTLRTSVNKQHIDTVNLSRLVVRFSVLSLAELLSFTLLLLHCCLRYAVRETLLLEWLQDLCKSPLYGLSRCHFFFSTHTAPSPTSRSIHLLADLFFYIALLLPNFALPICFLGDKSAVATTSQNPTTEITQTEYNL